MNSRNIIFLLLFAFSNCTGSGNIEQIYMDMAMKNNVIVYNRFNKIFIE